MFFKAAIALALSITVAADVSSQSTSTPVFLAPYRAFNRVEFGASLSDPGPGLAIEGFYRFGERRYDIGFRGGIADNGASSTQFLAGADFRTRVIDHSPDFPLDGALTAGIGGRFGDGVSRVFVPLGVSLGRRVQLEDSSVEFVPYFHPVLAPTFGDGESNLQFALGLGVDITFNKRFDIRVSGALGDYDGIGVSIAFLR